MIDETCAFITAIGMSMDFSVGTVTRHSYQAAFEAITGLDPLPAECAELSQCAERLLPNALSPSLIRQLGTDRNAWLDLLMSHHVIPALATDGLVVIDHYPAEQAALAKLNPKDERVAERFEIFFQGLELANGYRELLDSIELRERFEKDRCQRATIGAEEVQPDPALLAAMEQGLPDCCGVAVGFDRLVMSFCKLDTIDKAVSFAL